jgi:hypothetical protein
MHHLRHVSDIARGSIESVKLVAGALIKVTRIEAEPYDDPSQDLDKRHTICFVKDGAEATFFWSAALKVVRMDLVAMPAHGAKNLFAIEDLGRGLSGRVWLCATVTGRVCVLKFPNEKFSRTTRPGMSHPCDLMR